MKEELIDLGGNKYCYLDQEPHSSQSKATLLCLHGFPDQWYGWSSQISAWSEAGYRVILPHMLGYGKSDKPSEASSYSTMNLCQDLARLLDFLKLDRVFVIGHDWGALVAWRFALWYPHRVQALVSLSVVYRPPSDQYMSPSEIAKRVPNFAYQEYFADPRSTNEIENNLDVILAVVFQSPKPVGESGDGRMYVPIFGPGAMQAVVQIDQSSFQPPPMVISSQELNRYIHDFKEGGMNGPLSYYRNSQSRFEDEKEAGLPKELPATMPVLFIYGCRDETCQQTFVSAMPSLIPDLTIVPLEDKGHWLLLEAADEVNASVLGFLDAKVEVDH